MKRKILAAILISCLLALSAAVAEKKLNNVKISGSGTINGGEYGTIEVSGSAKIEGDVEAEVVDSSVSLKISGSLDANTVDSSGSIKVKGKLKARIFESSGSASFENLDASTVKFSGSLNSVKSVRAKSVSGTGSLEIGDTLEADEIKIKLAGDSSVKEIKGKTIDFREYSNWLSKIWKSYLTADKITGESIYLENTNAGLVKGVAVKIGPRCVIDTVEYKEIITVDPSSKVTKRSKE